MKTAKVIGALISTFIQVIVPGFELLKKLYDLVSTQQFLWFQFWNTVVYACVANLCIDLICLAVLFGGLRKRKSYKRTAWSFAVFVAATLTIFLVTALSIWHAQNTWWSIIMVIFFGIAAIVCVSLTVFPGIPFLKTLWVKLSNQSP